MLTRLSTLFLLIIVSFCAGCLGPSRVDIPSCVDSHGETVGPLYLIPDPIEFTSTGPVMVLAYLHAFAVTHNRPQTDEDVANGPAITFTLGQQEDPDLYDLYFQCSKPELVRYEILIFNLTDVPQGLNIKGAIIPGRGNETENAFNIPPDEEVVLTLLPIPPSPS